MLLWPAPFAHTILAFNNSMRKQFIITYFCPWYLSSNRLLLIICCFTTFIYSVFFREKFYFSQFCAWLSLLNWDDLSRSMLIIMHHDKYFFMVVLFCPFSPHTHTYLCHWFSAVAVNDFCLYQQKEKALPVETKRYKLKKRRRKIATIFFLSFLFFPLLLQSDDENDQL